ncbi:MAG: hypothetical protein V9E88_08435 [Ferruginibacter sp.]
MSSIHQKILIITAPSGAGKTSITHFLMREFPVLQFSISAATRDARGNEKHGVDYYFISMDEFKQKIQQKEFAEWEMVYEGKYYGTLKSELKRIWSNQRVPVLDIDVKGALARTAAIPRKYPEHFCRTSLRRCIENKIAGPGHRNRRIPSGQGKQSLL